MHQLHHHTHTRTQPHTHTHAGAILVEKWDRSKSDRNRRRKDKNKYIHTYFGFDWINLVPWRICIAFAKQRWRESLSESDKLGALTDGRWDCPFVKVRKWKVSSVLCFCSIDSDAVLIGYYHTNTHSTHIWFACGGAFEQQREIQPIRPSGKFRPFSCHFTYILQ